MKNSAKEYRDLSEAELEERCRETRRELFNMRLQQVTGQSEKPSRIKDLRRAIARMETVMRERNKLRGSA